MEIEDLVERIGKALDVDLKINHFPVTPLVALGHICEKVCKPFKVTPPIFPRRVDWYRQNRAFKIDRAKKELGYDPQIGLDDGLRRTGIWYRENGFI